MTNSIESFDCNMIKSMDSLLEDEITIFVEGVTDKDFFEELFDLNGISKSKYKIYQARNLEFDTQYLISQGISLPSGESGKIRLAAELVSPYTERTYFVSDRDLLNSSDLKILDGLKWTDFPALESYAFSEDIFDDINEKKFSNLFPHSSHYFPALTNTLIHCTSIRKNNMDSQKQAVNNFITSINSLDDLLTFRESIQDINENYSLDDIRSEIYGHDITRMFLQVTFEFKRENQHKIGSFNGRVFEYWMLHSYLILRNENLDPMPKFFVNLLKDFSI